MRAAKFANYLAVNHLSGVSITFLSICCTNSIVCHYSHLSTYDAGGEASADEVQIESPTMNDETRSGETGPGGVTPLAGNLQTGKFLTVAEVAAILRLSKMSVYRLIHSGQLEAVQFGRSFRVAEKALNTYLEHAYFSAG
jgi:excisionase family DNA binding protein